MFVWLMYGAGTFVWAVDLSGWFRNLYFLFIGISTVIILSNLIDTERDIIQIFHAFQWGVFVQGVIGWYEIFTRDYQFVEIDEKFIRVYIESSSHIPIGMSGNPNNFATLMFIGVFVSYMCYMTAKNKRKTPPPETHRKNNDNGRGIAAPVVICPLTFFGKSTIILQNQYGKGQHLMKITKELGQKPNDTTISSGNPVFLDLTKPPFRLHGFSEPYRRVPETVAGATSESVADLAAMSAGGRVRLRTDSDYIVIHAEIAATLRNPQDSEITTTGFDLYQMENGSYHFLGLMSPSQGEGKTYVESRVRLKPGMKNLMLHFPLFAKVKSACIALREGCELESASDYTYPVPVVFYGSSIVHGVGAGRPCSNYPAIISRRLDCDFINLGFSGAAKAEIPMIDYLASLPMSVLVYDYDHNAPDEDYLQKTHYAGYERFRAAQPDTPVIMASRVDYHSDRPSDETRRGIILESYRRGLAAGDKNLWFVDGSTIYSPELHSESTSDDCHPNDVGYLAMADAIGAAVKEALAKRQ